jgi:hypothetical protein
MTTEERNWKLYEESKENTAKNTAAKWAANEFSDKWLMTLAAGSFGLSFAFIEKLVPLSAAIDKPLLITAWACFAAVIILELIAFDIISYRFDRAIEKEARDLRLAYQGIEREPEQHAPLLDANRVIGYAVLCVFIAGIVSLITFVARNIL